MKVVFLITRLDYSGGPKMLAWVANQFAKAGNDVYFIAIYSAQINQPLEKSIHFFSLNFSQSKNRFIRNTIETIRIQYRLRKEVKKIKPDLMIGFLYPVDLYFTMFNNISRICKVILSQRFDPYSERGITSYVKERIIYMADGVVFQTEGALNYYKKSRIKKYQIIHNPVTNRTVCFAHCVKSFTERQNIVVQPARLNIIQKRQDVMIKAFEIIHKKHPEMKLVLLGDGPDKNEIESMVEKLNLECAVYIHSSIPTAEEFIKECKVVCMTSDFEGMPNSIIEAMAIGINVVSTDCRPGGARELIKNGYNGLTVNMGDYSGLADKVNYLIENPLKADEFVNAAREILKSHREANIAAEWIRFSEEIAFKRQRL